MKLDVSKFDQSRFFKGVDVERELKKLGKHEYVHTVRDVTFEQMQNGEERVTVWPNEDKRGFVLSAKFNLRAFTAVFGADDAGDWIGATYAMYVVSAHNPSTGAMGPALRARILSGPKSVASTKKPAAKKAVSKKPAAAARKKAA